MVIRQYFLVFFLVGFLACLFQIDGFSIAKKSIFNDFQKESEVLVVSKVIADKFGVEEYGAHLGFIDQGRKALYPDSVYVGYRLIGQKNLSDLDFLPYKSQFGLQGIVFSKVYHALNLVNITKLQWLNSILFAITIVMLCLCYRRIYGDLFAFIFFSTLISSPWIVIFARNLYWVPFLWFLPAVFAAFLYMSKVMAARFVFLLGIVFSVFIKSLCGYEYLSSITLFACSVFILAPFFEPNGIIKLKDIKMSFLVFMACIVGFTLAVCLHAEMRGDTILSGLRNIYEEDVKRRTLLGDPLKVAEVYRASLEASPLSVVFTYILNWKTAVFFWIPGSIFKYLFAFSLMGILYKFKINSNTKYRDAVTFAIFFLVPVSWFFLAKGHSFIHTHLNFVLWYLGFVPAIVFIGIDFIKLLFERFIYIEKYYANKAASHE